MKYTLRNREIPLCEEYDVIVAGGGPAGCAAAAASAREGAKTLLLESSGMLGGMATKGLVSSWTPYTDGIRIIYGGYSKRVFLETKSVMDCVPKDKLDWVSIDYETLKTVYDKLVSQAGAQILFHSTVCAVDMADERNIDTIIVANKSGLTAYRARVFIDCTADADLYTWAGGEYEIGENGDVQPSSLCFIITGVDEQLFSKEQPMYGGNADSPIHKIIADERYTIPDGHLVCGFIGPKTIGFNAGHIWNVDSTDPQSITKGILRGRALAREYFTALRELKPSFKDAYLVETAPTVGVRESRRIKGDYVFTLEDFMARRSFADEICRNNYFIDIHQSRDEVGKLKIHSDNRFEHYKTGESHGVPYRVLCPQAFDNLLVAGRSVSTDRITQGSLRVMPCCLCEGEAAGIAAAYCTEQSKVNIHTVDTQRLRKRLIECDGYLPRLESDTF